MSKKSSVGIYDLAEQTGYSISTVSKALNGRGRIGQSTRKKILEKAEELNYVGSYHARALSQKKSWLIGVIYIDDLYTGFSHPFFSVILEYFKRGVEEQGYEITFINKNSGHDVNSYLDFCKYRNIEGVFVLNADYDNPEISEIINSNIPIVSTVSGYESLITIASNDKQGGELAVDYLYELGHKDIYMVASPTYSQAGRDRIEGFKKGIEKYDLKTKIFEANNFAFENGYNAAMKLIQDKSIPTAIFASGDLIALGVIQALKEHGIKVPEDVSVLGYDNLYFMRYTTPALSTVNQQKDEIGRVSATTLIKMINGEKVESSVLDVNIKERKTCLSKS